MGVKVLLQVKRKELLFSFNLFSDFLYSFASVATSTAYKVKDSVKETVEKQVFDCDDFDPEHSDILLL